MCLSRCVCNLLLGPLILASDLLLLLWSEVVLNVEGLADLLGRLALDHVGNSLAANIEKRLNVQIIGSLERLVKGIFRQQRGKPTKMISKSISWSTCMNF